MYIVVTSRNHHRDFYFMHNHLCLYTMRMYVRPVSILEGKLQRCLALVWFAVVLVAVGAFPSMAVVKRNTAAYVPVSAQLPQG